MELLLSILAIVISIFSLISTGLIYKRQKNEAIIQAFFNDFSLFLSNAGQRNNTEALILLTKLKLQVGFLTNDLYAEFLNLLPTIEHLNLSKTNPNSKSDWLKIQNFILNFTKQYNPNTKLTLEYLSDNL